MPSITNYTSTLKPFNGIGMRNHYLSAPLLFLLFIFFLGTLVEEEYFQFIDKQSISQAQMWPTTIGRIVDFKTNTITKKDGRYSYHKEFQVITSYKFKVAGKEYFAQQEKFLDYPYKLSGIYLYAPNTKPILTYTADEERTFESRYQVGSTQSIRYNPTNPETAFIDIQMRPDGQPEQNRRTILIGSFLLGILLTSILSSGILKMR